MKRREGLPEREQSVDLCLYTVLPQLPRGHVAQEQRRADALLLGYLVSWCSLPEALRVLTSGGQDALCFARPNTATRPWRAPSRSPGCWHHPVPSPARRHSAAAPMQPLASPHCSNKCGHSPGRRASRTQPPAQPWGAAEILMAGLCRNPVQGLPGRVSIVRPNLAAERPQ